MFPDVGEFNLVVAGLATFAATVGYACTRRLSTTSATSSRPEPYLLQQIPLQMESDMQVDIDDDVKPADDEKESMAMEHDGALSTSVPLVTPPTTTITLSAPVPSISATTPPAPVRRGSLKRKAPEDGFDEPNVEDRGYPYNLANIYPNKRSRTPSSDSVSSTPSTPSRLTREPSPTLESTIDTTFDAVVVSHMDLSSTSVSTTVSEPTSSIDPAPTPATEPPTSPSPVPSPPVVVLEIKEVEEASPTPARSPTPVSVPIIALSPLFAALTPAPVGLGLAADTEKVDTKKTEAEKSSLPLALSALPAQDAARKSFPRTGFAAFANQDAFAASRPTTPKSTSTFTSTSSGFAAFAGSASPFAAAAALNKPPAAASSLFGTTTTSFFRLKPATNTVNSSTLVLPSTNIFGSGSCSAAGASNIFGGSAAAGNIFGSGSGKDVKATELLAAEKFLDDVLGSKKATGPTTSTGDDSAKQESDSEESAKDISRDADAKEKETREREEREKEEQEKEAERRTARAKAEEEVRLQEAREKQGRKEAKLRERQTGHAIVEAKTTAAHPTEKFIPVTGEEDENVEIEQKGVKLYIKRGDRPFSEGIPGLIKLLVNRTTAEERILFRREPLLKVSMNVRVQPTVRVTFVPEENVLRCILKEVVPPAEGEDGEPTQEVAIYVIKPARAGSKQDFKTFAEALMQRSQLTVGAEKLKTRSA